MITGASALPPRPSGIRVLVWWVEPEPLILVCLPPVRITEPEGWWGNRQHLAPYTLPTQAEEEGPLLGP